MLTIWWCPCVESSLVLFEEGVCYDQCLHLMDAIYPNGWMNSWQGYTAHLQDNPVLPSSPNSLGRPDSTNSCHSRVPTPPCSWKRVWFETGLKPPYLWLLTAVYLKPGRREQLGPSVHVQTSYRKVLWGMGTGTQVFKACCSSTTKSWFTKPQGKAAPSIPGMYSTSSQLPRQLDFRTKECKVSRLADLAELGLEMASPTSSLADKNTNPDKTNEWY